MIALSPAAVERVKLPLVFQEHDIEKLFRAAATLTGAKLEGAKLAGAEYTKKTKWPGDPPAGAVLVKK